MHRRHRKTLPGLWLMTDERVADDRLLAAARALPRGRAGIILRHYRTPPAQRRALFDALRAIARRRRLLLLLAGPARTAAAWRADGWHGRDGRRVARPLLHSAPAHDRREIRAAQRAGADLLFLSPLFPTRSHPGAPALGRARFAALARGARPPVIALGGVRAEQARGLALLGASGWAAIDGLTRNGGAAPAHGHKLARTTDFALHCNRAWRLIAPCSRPRCITSPPTATAGRSGSGPRSSGCAPRRTAAPKSPITR